MSGFKTTLGMPDIFDLMWGDLDNFFSSLYRGNQTIDGFQIKPTDIYRDLNYPPMNLWLNQDTRDLILEFAVAGIPMDNINIKVEGDYLDLEIDKFYEEERESYRLIRKGIKSGKIKQRIYIPASRYETDKVKAELRDGILLIKVSSKEEIKPKRVSIEYSSGRKSLE